MSDRVVLCMIKLKWYTPSKKCSWRAVVVMRWTEIIYQEVSKSRLKGYFNKIPGEREREDNFLTVIFTNKGELTEQEKSLFAD